MIEQACWNIGKGLLVLFVVLGFIFLVAPLVIVIPLSFNAEPYFTFTEGMLRLDAEAYSLRWYQTIFSDESWLRAIRNSFFIGILATVVATTLGTAAALGMNDPKFPFRKLVGALIISPIVTPIIVVAVSVYFFYTNLGLGQTFLGIILAHAMIGAPYVVITVSASLAGFDHNLMRAATSLGANQFTAFRRVQLPIISRGVFTGALFAFITSFDEVVIVLFMAGLEQRTIPRELWSGIREDISPTVLAVATLLILMVILVLVSVEVLKNLSERDSSVTK